MVGSHLILDLHEVSNEQLLYDIPYIETVLSQAAIMCGATILSTKFHEFGEGCGITGVIVLSESHVSIHTWRETSFAAIDIFMCGKCNPEDCIGFILDAFKPDIHNATIMKRGVVS